MTDTKHSTRITLRQTAPKSMPYAHTNTVHMDMGRASKAENIVFEQRWLTIATKTTTTAIIIMKCA